MAELFNDILKADESIFLNPQFLDYDYMPKVILYRENEQKYIASALKPLLQGRNGKNLLIKGGPGIGKTIAAKHVLMELEDEFGSDVNCIYINCWKKDTTFKIAMEMCEQLKYKWVHNKNSDELLKEACKLLNEKSAVVVLDEVDKLEDDNIIYILLEDLSRKSLILITNSNGFLVNLDNRIRSRLTPDILDFRSYNFEETKGILKNRLEYAFVANIFNNEAFNKIVEKTFEASDLRVGLFLLKESGELAEAESKRKIELNHGEKAIEKLDEFKLKNIEAFENENGDLINLIKDNNGKTMTDLFELYKKSEGKSYKTLQRKIKYLEKIGVVKLKEINAGSGRSFTVDYCENKKLNEFS